jgi:MFS family permease
MVKAYATFSGISSFQVLAMFRRGLFYTFLSLYIREYLGLSVTETTLFATCPMVANSLCQMFLWGSLSDRLQLRRTFIIVGEVLAAIGTLALWYAHLMPESKRASGYVLIVGLSIIEVFWSMSNVGWSALISDIYKPKERSTIQGQLISIGAIGRIIGVYIGGTLYDGLGAYYKGWGFREGTLFFAAAGAMLLSTVPMLFVPEGGVKRDKAQPTEANDESGRTSRVFLLFLMAVAMINFGRNSMAVLRTPFVSLENGLALAPHQIAWITNIQSLAMIIMGPMVGILCRRLNDGRALLTGAGIATISLFVFGFAPHFGVACLGNTLTGASESIIVASSYSLASVLIPAGTRGRNFGWFNATYFLSWGIGGTLVIGPLIDALMYFGTSELFAYRMGFLTAMAITTVGAALLCYLIFGVMKRDEMENPELGDLS